MIIAMIKNNQLIDLGEFPDIESAEDTFGVIHEDVFTYNSREAFEMHKRLIDTCMLFTGAFKALQDIENEKEG